jgi:septum site-determining protein MinC
MPTSVSTSKIALEFKSASLTVPVLLLLGNDMPTLEQQLQEKIQQAPEFFKHSPLLIDLHKLQAQNLEISLAELNDMLRKLAFMPVGIRGGNEQNHQQAIELGLPVHNLHATSAPAHNKPEAKAVIAPTVEAAETAEPASIAVDNKLITQPIRSGQRVYAKGDLIITSTVSAGAEIMAEGNIHVYGSLRGRALAGVLGNEESRIFCSDLQAELISIAGIYQLSEDISKRQPHTPVQICLSNQTLVIKDL